MDTTMTKDELLEKLITLRFDNVGELHTAYYGITAQEIMERQNDPSAAFHFAEVQDTSNTKTALNEILEAADTETIEKIHEAFNGKKEEDMLKAINLKWSVYSDTPITPQVREKLQEAEVDDSIITKLAALKTAVQIRKINGAALQIFPQYSIYDWQEAGLERKIINRIMAQRFPQDKLYNFTLNMPQAKAILEALGTEIKDIKDPDPQIVLMEKLQDSLMKGPLEEHAVKNLQEAGIDNKSIDKLKHMALYYSPPTDASWNMMKDSESKTAFIDMQFADMGSTHAENTRFLNLHGADILAKLRAANFSPQDYVGSNMSLALLQEHYSVDRLQEAGFVLKELIAARKQSNITVFKPLIATSRKGGLFGRIYTESITVDFARQLLSAGLTTKELHNELKTYQLPLLRRFVTNLHVLQARVLNAMSSNKQAQVEPHIETSPYKPLSTDEIKESNNSLASTAPLSRRDSDSSLESEPGGSLPTKSVP